MKRSAIRGKPLGLPRDRPRIALRSIRATGARSHGREASLVGRPDFKSGKGCKPVLGGFDSHSLPPVLCSYTFSSVHRRSAITDQRTVITLYFQEFLSLHVRCRPS